MNQEWKLENNLKHIQNLLNPMQAECSDLKEHIQAMQFYIRQRCVEFASIIKKVNSKGEDRTILAQIADLETLFHLLKEDVQDGQVQVQDQLKQISMTTESLKIYENKLNSVTELLQEEKKNLMDSCALELSQSLNLLEEQRRINQEQHKQFNNENKQLNKVIESKDQEIQQLKSLNLYIRNNLQNAQQKCKEEVQFMQTQMAEQIANLNKKMKKNEEEFNYRLSQLTEQAQCKYEILKQVSELKVSELENANQILQSDLQKNINKLNYAQLDLKTLRQEEAQLKELLKNQNQKHQYVVNELRDQNNQLKNTNQQLVYQQSQNQQQIQQLNQNNEQLNDQLQIKDQILTQTTNELSNAQMLIVQYQENETLISQTLYKYCDQMKYSTSGDNIQILVYVIKRGEQTLEQLIDSQEVNQDLKNQIEYLKLEAEKQLHHLKDENLKLNSLIIEYGEQVKDTIFNRNAVRKDHGIDKSTQCISHELDQVLVPATYLMGSISNFQSSSDISIKSQQESIEREDKVKIEIIINNAPTEVVEIKQNNQEITQQVLSIPVEPSVQKEFVQKISTPVQSAQSNKLNQNEKIEKSVQNPQKELIKTSQHNSKIKERNRQGQPVQPKPVKANQQTQTTQMQFNNIQIQTDEFIDMQQQQLNQQKLDKILELENQVEEQKLSNKQRVSMLSRQINQLLDQQSQLHKQYQILEYERNQHQVNIQKKVYGVDQEIQTTILQETQSVALQYEQQESEKQSLQDQQELLFSEMTDNEQPDEQQIQLDQTQTLIQQTTIYPSNICESSQQQTLSFQEPLKVTSSRKSRRIQVRSTDQQEKESTVIKQQLLDIGQQYVTQYSNNFESFNHDQTIDMYHPFSTRHQNMRQQSKDREITQLRQEVDKLRKLVQSLKSTAHSDIRGKSLDTCDIKELRVQFTQHQLQANGIIRYLQNEIENYKHNYNLFNSARNEHTPNDPMLRTRTKMAPNSPKRIFQNKKQVITSEIKFPRTQNPAKRNHSLYTNPMVSYDMVQNASHIVKSLRAPQKG